MRREEILKELLSRTNKYQVGFDVYEISEGVSITAKMSVGGGVIAQSTYVIVKNGEMVTLRTENRSVYTDQSSAVTTIINDVRTKLNRYNK